MKLETPVKTISGSSSSIFAFLSDLNNLESMMPEQVINWKSDADKCSFTIKGMSDMQLEVRERVPESKVVMASGSSKPFPFTLTSEINPNGENADVKLVFDGDVPIFMKMMIERPLSNFFNLLLEGLEKKFKP
ncbi:MAG: SRPBCC family protein [Bacteroidia bacterium]